MKKSSPIVISLALLVAPAAVTKAALIAYEGFGSGDNGTPLPGLGGGSGFDGNWTSFYNADYLKRYNETQPGHPSYFYPSNVGLGYTTGAVQQDNAYLVGIYQRALAANTINLGADGQYFISFIFRSFSTENNGQATVNFAAGSGENAEALQFGYIWSNAFTAGMTTASSYTFGSEPGLAQSSAFAGNTTYFVVGMINASASSSDQVFLKAYNASTELVASGPGGLAGVGSGIDQWSVASTFTSNAEFDRLGILSTGPGFFTLDEIRVGTTWADVTGIPEPSSYASLFAVFSIALAATRRRRQAA